MKCYGGTHHIPTGGNYRSTGGAVLSFRGLSRRFAPVEGVHRRGHHREPPAITCCHLRKVVKYRARFHGSMPRKHAIRSALDRRLDEMHADLCKVFSNPVRVGLLVLLMNGERSVGSLARSLRVSVPTASKHLRVMRERGVLEASRGGNVVYYHVTSPKVLRAFSMMREVLLARLRKTNRVLGVI